MRDLQVTLTPTGERCAAGETYGYRPPKATRRLEFPQSVPASRLAASGDTAGLLALVEADDDLTWSVHPGRLGQGAALSLVCDRAILATWQLDEGWEGMGVPAAVRMAFGGPADVRT